MRERQILMLNTSTTHSYLASIFIVYLLNFETFRSIILNANTCIPGTHHAVNAGWQSKLRMRSTALALRTYVRTYVRVS